MVYKCIFLDMPIAYYENDDSITASRADFCRHYNNYSQFIINQNWMNLWKTLNCWLFELQKGPKYGVGKKIIITITERY